MRSKRQLICEVHPNHMPVILDNHGSKSHITVASRFFLFTVDCCWLLTTGFLPIYTTAVVSCLCPNNTSSERNGEVLLEGSLILRCSGVYALESRGFI